MKWKNRNELYFLSSFGRLLIISLILSMISNVTNAVDIVADSKSFNSTYNGYRFKVDALIESGEDCRINSALIGIYTPNNTMDIKKIDSDKVIKFDNFGMRFIRAYRRDNVDYVEFEIRNASEAENETEGAITITSMGYTPGYRNYKFKVDHLVYGTGCNIKKIVLSIMRPDKGFLKREISMGSSGIVDGIEIKAIDAYRSKSISYAEILTTEPQICYDTDRGNNTKIRGVCSDNNGQHIDICINDKIVEYACINKKCTIVATKCEDGICKNGKCITIETVTTTSSTTILTLTTISTISTSTSSTACYGCILDERCIPYGTRINSTYCSSTGIIKPQLKDGSLCKNNYQCISNLCSNNRCIKRTHETKKDILQEILEFLINIFQDIFRS